MDDLKLVVGDSTDSVSGVIGVKVYFADNTLASLEACAVLVNFEGGTHFELEVGWKLANACDSKLSSDWKNRDIFDPVVLEIQRLL